MKLKAHAKVNLGLRVLAKRPDGFHAIDTLFARLALHDELWLEPQPSDIRLEVTGADLPEDSSNLAYQAAEAYLQASGFARGVNIRLKKNIPVAAGLGGGSSDAAAVLKGLSRLYPSPIELQSLARDLGSDVPFFLSDYGAARGQGRGERLTPIRLPKLTIVLVNPGIAIRAASAYKGLTSFGEPLELPSLLHAFEQGRPAPYVNDLQAGVLELEPYIKEVLAGLEDAGLQAVLMSGSGATCFGLATSAKHAELAADTLGARFPDSWVYVTETLSGGDDS